jgi:carbon storage regulator
MLILGRKLGTQVVIDGDIILTVVDIKGSQVTLGFSAPEEVVIDRMEVHLRKLSEQEGR